MKDKLENKIWPTRPPHIDRLLYGGSFDPPHLGHTSIVSYILKQKLASCVEVTPAQISPFKEEELPLPANQRLKLLRSALQSEVRRNSLIKERAHILTFELRHNSPSYTINTCLQLQQEFPQQTIGILIGSDNLAELDRWQRAEELLRKYPILVFRRQTELAADTKRILSLQKQFHAKGIYLLPNSTIDCSSTKLRKLLAAGSYDSPVVRNCLDENILAEIVKKGLYDQRQWQAYNRKQNESQRNEGKQKKNRRNKSRRQ